MSLPRKSDAGAINRAVSPASAADLTVLQQAEIESILRRWPKEQLSPEQGRELARMMRALLDSWPCGHVPNQFLDFVLSAADSLRRGDSFEEALAAGTAAYRIAITGQGLS